MAGCVVLHSVQPGAHLAMGGHTHGSPEAYPLMGDTVQPKRILKLSKPILLGGGFLEWCVAGLSFMEKIGPAHRF